MRNDLASALALLEQLPGRVLFGSGRLAELGESARAEGAGKVLLVSDPGIIAAGHVNRAVESLRRAPVSVIVFDRVAENPTTDHVIDGVAVARAQAVDFIIALGGGSAMDCAKGINLLLTNGGQVADYWGINKAVQPMLPSMAVPTTAGTGSEAQSFALISDAVTHRKMACGDRRLPHQGGLRPRVVILDPDLTATAPRRVAAAAGIDAIAHAVETAASKARTPSSRRLSLAAWHLLMGAPPLPGVGDGTSAFETVMQDSGISAARANMLLGAHLAGAAIEQSMLGAAHACANPLTARFQITHGVAVGLMLPHVVRFNSSHGENPYSELVPDPEELARILEGLGRAAQLPKSLTDCAIPESALPELAATAAQEWTATFNPRLVSPGDLLALYRSAL